MVCWLSGWGESDAPVLAVGVLLIGGWKGVFVALLVVDAANGRSTGLGTSSKEDVDVGDEGPGDESFSSLSANLVARAAIEDWLSFIEPDAEAGAGAASREVVDIGVDVDGSASCFIGAGSGGGDCALRGSECFCSAGTSSGASPSCKLASDIFGGKIASLPPK